MMTKDLLSLPYPELSSQLAKMTREFIAKDLAKHGQALTPDLREGTGAYLLRGGKCLRPVLLLLSALAAGASEVESLLPAAAGVECYHTGTLVHDDIIDHDTLRRGQATVHALIANACPQRHPRLFRPQAEDFGVATAILAGDLLYANSSRLLAQVPGVSPEVLLSILRCQNGILIPELLQGEQLDVELETKRIEEVEMAEVLQMNRLKTGALLAFAAKVGVALGSQTPVEASPLAEKLGKAVEDAGVAFQLQDDYLGLFGDEQQLGKPIGSDLREGKITPLILYAWQNASTDAREKLVQIIGNKELTLENIAFVQQLVQQTGALAHIQEMAMSLTAAAQEAFRQIPVPEVSPLLLAWLNSLLKRSK